MAETKMPAAEASVASQDLEKNSYELAFHVLPTVAEGEVEGVYNSLKELISKHGEIFDEEVPARFELAYEIVKQIEGKNRKFSSAYFGWVRFTAASAEIETLTHEVDSRPELLRYMLTKLTKVEEANPFRFHEALKDEKMVTTVEESSVVPDTATGADSVEETGEKKTEDESKAGEVDEEKLEEALESKKL